MTDWKPIIRNYERDGNEPTRFHVIDRRLGGVRATLETESFFAFHHNNAWEEGDRLELDGCASRDPSIIDTLYLDRLRSRDRRPRKPTHATRFTLDLAARRVRHRQLHPVEFELPRINYERANGRPYRYAYGAGLRDPRRSGFIDQLVKLDTGRGEARTWHEHGAYPGEPVFVAAPGARAKDDGVVLSVVLDSLSARSYLLVLDAGSLTEIARACVPHHIPFGFHGRLLQTA